MPELDALRETVTDVSGVLHFGFDILVGAQIALIAAVLFGFCREPVRRGSHRTGAAVALAATAFAALFALLHAANWWMHGVGLESTLGAPNGVANVSELAEHISGTLTKSLIATLCLMIHSLLIATLAVMLPGPESVSDESLDNDGDVSR
jgi:hypothetical protein